MPSQQIVYLSTWSFGCLSPKLPWGQEMVKRVKQQNERMDRQNVSLCVATRAVGRCVNLDKMSTSRLS